MKRILRLIGYILLGVTILLVTANQFIRVTGGPQNAGQGIIYFFLTEKLFAKHKTATDKDGQDGKSHHLALSYEALKEAETIFSQKTPDTFNSTDLENVITALERALENADLVSDFDLEQLHPQMKTEFRQKYEPALRKMIKGFKYRDQSSAIEGFELYQRYTDWVFSHQKEISSN